MSTLGIIRPKAKLKCEHAFNKASKFNTYIFNDIASASRVLCPSAFRENVLCPLEGPLPMDPTGVPTNLWVILCQAEGWTRSEWLGRGAHEHGCCCCKVVDVLTRVRTEKHEAMQSGRESRVSATTPDDLDILRLTEVDCDMGGKLSDVRFSEIVTFRRKMMPTCCRLSIFSLSLSLSLSRIHIDARVAAAFIWHHCIYVHVSFISSHQLHSRSVRLGEYRPF